MSMDLKSLSRFFCAMAVIVTSLVATTSLGKTSREKPAELPDPHIIWADADKTRPAFIPQKLLQGTELKDLPLDQFDREHLRERLRISDLTGGACEKPKYSARPPVQGEADVTFDFPEFLLRYPARFVGRIHRIDSGWGNDRGMVAELLWLEVVETLGGESEGTGLHPGEILSVMYYGGKTIVGESSICQERWENLYSPTVGDRVVVGGNLSRADPPHFYGVIFPVINDSVHAQPFHQLSSGASALELGRLREKLRPDLRTDPEQQ